MSRREVWDPVAVIGAAYRLEGARAAWLRGVAEALRPAFPDDAYVAAGLFAVHRRGVKTHANLELGEAGDHERETVSRVVERALREVAPFSTHAAGTRSAALFVARGSEVDGVWITALFEGELGIAPAELRRFARVSTQVGSALRLRSALVPRVEDDESPITVLRDVILRDVPAGDVHPSNGEGEEEIELWSAVVEARWSLVDCFDTNGRRFFVAARSPVGSGDPRRLTSSELECVQHASLGRTNAEIAYALEASESTIGAHVSRALRKLGVQRRAQLVLLRHGVSRARVLRLAPDVAIAVASAAAKSSESPLSLTAAESAVLAQVVAGASNADIARRRGTSVRTIANQVSALLRKHGVHTREELCRLVLGRERPE